MIKRNPIPKDFRAAARKVLRLVGLKKDSNSRHVGSFRGGIVPMKRRYRISRTAK